MSAVQSGEDNSSHFCNNHGCLMRTVAYSYRTLYYKFSVEDMDKLILWRKVYYSLLKWAVTSVKLKVGYWYSIQLLKKLKQVLFISHTVSAKLYLWMLLFILCSWLFRWLRFTLCYCFQATNPEDIPPIISTPHHYLINIFRNNLHFIAVVTTEGEASVLLLPYSRHNQQADYSANC